ncbi:MAG: formylmethanofuran dehydrogenase subunit A [Gammaproteobacteria bacterium]
MLIKLTGGIVYDPAHGVNGVRRDIFIADGHIIRNPPPNRGIDREFDITGNIVMAGAIDIHSHIGGGKVNAARMLMPEEHRSTPVSGKGSLRSGSGRVTPTSFLTGYRYAEMGYTACFEPAMLPANARQAHLEMADIPIIDAGAYALLGNDDFLLRRLGSSKEAAFINDYVAWTLKACKAIGIKVVNPGGINAFKFNQRSLDLDERHVYYRVTPRQVLLSLARAVHELGVPHPLHVHGCNLGVPGNVDTTLRTIQAMDGLPLHLTHIQFHSYGAEGKRGFSSGAFRIAEAVNSHAHISVDVGQVLFGQTVTASGDTMQQYRGHRHARPRKWVCMDIECDAGCGIVPFRYRDRSFVNALQWCIGLELFLLVDDPWRIFLTTDHPNGAPFTSYPHLIRLLMDRPFRMDVLESIHPDARQASLLDSIDREYSLYEIAIMTRAAPARSLGLTDRGHLGPGAWADVVIYTDRRNREEMFAKPRYVFKDGELVARNGRVTQHRAGSIHVVEPEYDPGIERMLKRHFDRFNTVKLGNFKILDDELLSYGRRGRSVHPCRPRPR